MRSASYFPPCAVAWGTNLEVLELDLTQVSHVGGTDPELSSATDSLRVWDLILVTHASDSGPSIGHSGVLNRRDEVISGFRLLAQL